MERRDAPEGLEGTSRCSSSPARGWPCPFQKPGDRDCVRVNVLNPKWESNFARIYGGKSRGLVIRWSPFVDLSGAVAILCNGATMTSVRFAREG